MPSFGGFSSVRFKDAQTKNQSGSQQGVYNIITSYEEIGYNHPFCKILRPESILVIPVNDNGLKKKVCAINSFLKTSWLDPMLRLLSKILALAKKLSLVDHPLQVVLRFALPPAFLLCSLSTCIA